MFVLERPPCSLSIQEKLRYLGGPHIKLLMDDPMSHLQETHLYRIQPVWTMCQTA